MVGPVIRDITRPLGPGTPVYPGDDPPSVTGRTQDGYAITDLHITSHTGTHLDAPSHYLPGGTTVDRIPFARLMGRARVIGLEGAGDAIIPADLAGKLGDTGRLLLRTRASGTGSFGEDYPHLTLEAARFLAGAGIAALGIDSPSIEAPGGGGAVHRELLGKGIAILEFLDLSGVPDGEYLLLALPLRLEGGDGAPARVILLGGAEGAGP